MKSLPENLTRQIERHIDLERGTIDGIVPEAVRLSDMRHHYLDQEACEALLSREDPVVYSVASVESEGGTGDLNVGLGRIMPGQIGREYFMTKGHFHAWRDAAEIYIGLEGDGLILLEGEEDGQSRIARLAAHDIVYVAGHTAHRTLNVGPTPLTYLGIYPARAGHDYGSIAEKNFSHLVLNARGVPTLLKREDSAGKGSF